MRVWIVATYGEFYFDLFETQDFKEVEREIDATENLRTYLFRRTKDMRIILGKSADAR